MSLATRPLNAGCFSPAVCTLSVFPARDTGYFRRQHLSKAGAIPGLEVGVGRDGDVLTVRGDLGNPVSQVPLRVVPAPLTCSSQSLRVQSQVPTAGGAGRPFLAVQVTAVVQGPRRD